MNLNTSLNTDDDKFVEAILDSTKRQERIDRLSRSRRTLNIVTIIQAICAAFQMLLYLVARYTSPPSPSDSSSFVLPLVSLSLFVALGLYTDLQIKFLKADAAREAKMSG